MKVTADGSSYPIEPARLRNIRRKLLAWFDREKRDLPWRNTSDPYAIWLSESMLQQTQVATVIPYYHRFLSKFPTVKALADADLDEVLRLWAGLGYYARARNLHRAARMVANQFGGKFPATAAALRELPGVGDYTAGAVASIAFGECTPVVDGNVSRVFARVFDLRSDVRTGAGKSLVWQIAAKLVPENRSGDFNQALMELGATVCLPKAAARCLSCPLRGECEAAARGTVASLPIRTQKTAVKREVHVVAAIESRGKWLFVRRPASGLWGGLWEMPTIASSAPAAQKAGAESGTAALAADVAESRVSRDRIVSKRPFCDFTHQLTHRTIRFVGHHCRLKGSPPKSKSADERWLTLDEAADSGISNAMQKVLAELRKAT